MTLSQTHLKSGLSKLQEAAELVDRISSEAEVQKVELAVKQDEADKALVTITAGVSQASERQVEVAKIKEFVMVEEGKIKVRRDVVEADLAEIQVCTVCPQTVFALNYCLPSTNTGDPAGAGRGEGGRGAHPVGQHRRDPEPEDAPRGDPRRDGGRAEAYGHL